MDNFREAIEIERQLRGEPKTYEEAIIIVTEALKKLVISKDKKYGKNPIKKFGHHGIVIRSSDKLDRLYNGVFNGTDLGAEGILDSYGDLSGYGLQGVMKELGWFELENES